LAEAEVGDRARAQVVVAGIVGYEHLVTHGAQVLAGHRADAAPGQRLRQTALYEFRLSQKSPSCPALAQVAPEGPMVGRIGELTGDADDGDAGLVICG